ncbi:hypothetical protein FOZ63_011108, partial [Perkinsus olseni]
ILWWPVKSASPDVGSRQAVSFSIREKTMKTVIGFRETEDGELSVIDVAQSSFPDGTGLWLKFAFLADEDALKEEFDSPTFHRILEENDSSNISPAVLKTHLMENFINLEIQERYHKKFSRAKHAELHCKLTSSADTRLPPWDSWDLSHGFEIHYTIYLTRAEASEPLVLRAMEADLSWKEGYKW